MRRQTRTGFRGTLPAAKLCGVSDRSDTPGPARDVPLNLVAELFRAVPKLVDRTRSQAELVASLAGHVPCLSGLLGLGTAPHADEDLIVPGMHEKVPIDVLSLLEGEPSTDGEGIATSGSNGTTPAAEPAAAPGSAGPSAATPTEAELPIPDYDSLAASQVVPRLATLSPDELQSVRSYELAHRNRQTILNRVGQRLAD